MEGVTDALFLDFRNYHNRTEDKNIAGVTPRGVVYTLRSVLRGLTMSSLAHFTGVYILLRGCLLCLFSCMAVEGLEVKQTEVKHPRFSFVVN